MSSADEHRLAILAEREEGIRLALEYPSGVMRPGHYVAHYSRAELTEELGAIARERRGLQSRQPRRPAAASPECRTSRRGHPTPPVQNRRNTLKHLKHIIGAAVILADILFGMALPEVMRNLHKETHAHQYGSVGLYVVLALLTLWVIVSVVRGVSDSAPKPAPRAGGYPFRGGL